MLAQLNAALEDRYTIEREIGRGGMATVYLARDRKHDRRVALKVLDPELGAVLGVERFLAEIKVTANLQHPNLLPLFDSGEAGGLLYYVMPFVEGESLRARLDREKQLPVDEAIRITAAIANALETAHVHGVVHRDLKPENVLLQAGEPIVADFGIALAVSRAGGARVTQTGLSLGTPQYMSPEQATGDRSIDARSDIYSLGAMLYEMLTGEPPHTGATAQSIIARVVTETPRPIRATRPAVPDHVDAAAQRALEKLPADRWPNAAAFRAALLSDASHASAYRTRALMPARASRRLTVALASLLAIATAGFMWMLAVHLRDSKIASPRLRFALPANDIISDEAGEYYAAQFAFSDDGTMLAYVARDTTGAKSVWLRKMDEASPRRIPGTDGAASPFWSPDGRSLGFFANGKIERYDLGQGVPRTVADVGGDPGGAAWMANGDIVASRGTGPLVKVSSNGGAVTPITQLDSAHGELQHVTPMRLADGRHFLYTAFSYSAEYTGGLLSVGSVDGGKTTLVMHGRADYAAPNHLLVKRDADLVALPFDQKTFAVDTAARTVLSGEPVGAIAASANGTIAWLPGAPAGTKFMAGWNDQSSIELIDRQGRTVRVIGPQEFGVDREYYAPRLSHDGRLAAAEHHLGQGGGDIYVFDVATGAQRRETFAPTSHSGFVAWSPDDKRIVFNTTRAGGGTIFMKTVGVADEKTFIGAVASSWPSDWSRDGQNILFDRPSTATQSDVWIAPAGGGAAKPILATPANEMQAVFSPDGKWIAYASDEENGRFNVYVRPFPLTAEQWKVSENGGEAPRWRADGKELFFLARHDHDVSMMAAAVDASTGFHAGKPAELFRRPIAIHTDILRSGVYYDVTPDGQRFVATLLTHAAVQGGAALQVFVNALAGGDPHPPGKVVP